jgi:hypothetical protein
LKDLITFADFPVRPVIFSGESLVGYIYRIFSENEHRIPIQLVKSLHILNHGRRRDAENASKLIQSFLDNTQDIDFNELVDRTRTDKNDSKIWGLININDISFCPLCLTEKGFHYSIWELSLMQACPVHRCGLLNTCTECNRKLDWHGLKPNWSCRCGKTVKTMQTSLAKSGRYALAQLIVHSSSAALLPKGFHKAVGKPNYNPISTGELYDLLEMGFGLAEIFSHSKTYNIRKIKDSGFVKEYPLSTLSWGAKLLLEPNDRLLRRLNRLLMQYFKKKREFFIVRFGSADLVVVAAKFIDKQSESLIKQKILDALGLTLKNHRYEFPVKFLVFYSPKLTQTQFDSSLQFFGEWWRKLAVRMATLDSNLKPIVQRKGIDKYYFIGVDHYIYEIANALLYASHKNVDVETFQALAHWWHIPEKLRKPTPTQETLYQLGIYLHSLSKIELNFFYDLVMDGRKRMFQ